MGKVPKMEVEVVPLRSRKAVLFVFTTADSDSVFRLIERVPMEQTRNLDELLARLAKEYHGDLSESDLLRLKNDAESRLMDFVQGPQISQADVFSITKEEKDE